MPSISRLCLVVLLLPLSASAHFPWIAAETLAPAPGEALALQIAFGDRPDDFRALVTDRLQPLQLHTAGGDVVDARPEGNDALRLHDVGSAGVALVGGRQQRSFWTRTPEGGKRASRAELSDATHCSHANNAFKALLAVGEGAAGEASKVLGHPLELVLQADPHGLAPGEPLPLRVLFEGEALHGATVEAWPLTGEAKATEAVSTSGGELELTLGAGTWLLHTAHATPYADPAVCDENSHHATLVLRRD
ncbi:DUF4198 domain-containing protein [Algiphilus aromaticivorans]|uniref:DUF4198 domain-containing protein n=1 Tax=Algiphilus aromaticivorans TaxID=382454 RepID=UPI0005C1543D|nr:DUF4198 domain-containing protein [Algiphilus aromaticivorans]